MDQCPNCGKTTSPKFYTKSGDRMPIMKVYKWPKFDRGGRTREVRPFKINGEEVMGVYDSSLGLWMYFHWRGGDYKMPIFGDSRHPEWKTCVAQISKSYDDYAFELKTEGN